MTGVILSGVHSFRLWCVCVIDQDRSDLDASSPTLNTKENGSSSCDRSSLWLRGSRCDAQAFFFPHILSTHKSPISAHADGFTSQMCCARAHIGFPNRNDSHFSFRRWKREGPWGDVFEMLSVKLSDMFGFVCVL